MKLLSLLVFSFAALSLTASESQAARGWCAKCYFDGGIVKTVHGQSPEAAQETCKQAGGVYGWGTGVRCEIPGPARN